MDLDEMMNLMQLEPVPTPAPEPSKIEWRKPQKEEKKYDIIPQTPELTASCVREIAAYFSNEELDTLCLVCQRWKQAVYVEIANRRRVMERKFFAVKRKIAYDEDTHYLVERRLKAFYEARAEAIQANKDRNRKHEEDRTILRKQQNEMSDGVLSISKATSLIPPEVLANAPPERMKMLIAAIQASKNRPTPEAPNTKTIAVPAEKKILQKNRGGGNRAANADALLERLITEAVQDEAFLEAHKLKELRSKLSKMRTAVSEAAAREEFLEAHKAKGALSKFLESLEKSIINTKESLDATQSTTGTKKSSEVIERNAPLTESE